MRGCFQFLIFILAIQSVACGLLPPKESPPPEKSAPAPSYQSEPPIPIQHHLNQPIHYLDNQLAFQPKRIWRLWVSWELDLKDRNRAYVVKEYQFIVHDP